MNAFFTTIASLVNMVTSPISNLVSKFVPDFGDSITRFTYVLNNFVVNGVGYFFSWIPSGTLGILQIFLNTLIIFYGFYASIHAIFKIFNVIKNIKFW